MSNVANGAGRKKLPDVAITLHSVFRLIAVAAIGAVATVASAKDSGGGQTPALVRSLIACRDIADDADRLRCFDQTTQTIAAAIQSNSVVVVDRAQVEKARREDFGARRPARGLPAPTGVDAGQLSSIDGTVARASQGSDGWIVTLKDGSVWRQTDDTPLGLPPRAGDKVTVTRAALGTFKLKVGRQPAMRVRRVA